MSASPWFKVDDGFHGHPKVMDLSPAAVGIWTLTGSWCAKYLTDGHVPDRALLRLGGTDGLAAELVDAGLWCAADGGFQFKDWGQYQPLKEEVEAERLAAQERMKKVRAAKKGVRPNETRTTDERSPEHPENFGGSSEEVRLTPTQSQSQSLSLAAQEEEQKKKKTALPDSWAPTSSHIEFARKERIDLMAQVDKFRLHAQTHDRRVAVWNAAFTSWLKKSLEFNQPVLVNRDAWMNE